MGDEEKGLNWTIGEETKEFDKHHVEATTKLALVNDTIEDLLQQLTTAEVNALQLHMETVTHINNNNIIN